MWTEDGVTEKERTHCINFFIFIVKFHSEIITQSFPQFLC